MPPADNDSHEVTFFIEGHHADSPNDSLTFLVKAATHQQAIDGLATRGYICKTMTQVSSPTEAGFQQRLDGTVLVTATQDDTTIRYGPFNDEADAYRWIELKMSAVPSTTVHYTVHEPVHCFRIELVNNLATILTLPDDFFSSPL